MFSEAIQAVGPGSVVGAEPGLCDKRSGGLMVWRRRELAVAQVVNANRIRELVTYYHETHLQGQ